MSLTQPVQCILNGIPLDQPDNGSTYRVVERLTGWDDGPAIRLTMVQRAQQHGAHRSTGFYDARIVQVEGVCQASSLAALYAFTDGLRSIPPTSPVTFTASSPDLGNRSAQVQVQSGPVFTFSGLAVTYTMTLVAADPTKFGDAVQSSATLASTAAGSGFQYPAAYPVSYGVAAGVTPGSLSLPNAGTATYWPTIRLDGPVTNPQLSSDQGDWVRFNGTLLAGQWLLIDCGRRRVLLNGSLQASQKSKITSSGRWLGVIPGGAMLSWTADTADPAALFTAYGFLGAWS